MKYLKMLGLMAVAAAALMAFAGSASATELTSPKGVEYGVNEGLTATSEGHAVLKGSFGVKVECESHVAGTITASGGALVEGDIEELSFSPCTNNYEAHVEKNGTLAINSSSEVFGDGNRVQVTTPLGINCTYETGNTKLGTLTESTEKEDTATFNISATIPRVAGSFLCGSSGAWEGSYLVETPDELFVD